MSGLRTAVEDGSPDISVTENHASTNQDTSSDTGEETVVIIPDDQAVEGDVPAEAAEQIKSSMKPKTAQRITNLVKKGHEKDRTIEEKDQELKELRERVERVESKSNEREAKETRAVAEGALAQLQNKRKEAYEDQDWDTINKLDTQIAQASAMVNNVPQGGFDSKAYFTQNNEWFGKDLKKTKVAERINDEIWDSPKFSNYTPQQKLDEVARQTNAMFNENPHSSSSPTDGAPIGRPSKNTVYITQSDWDYLKSAHPHKSEAELLEYGKKLKKRTKV